MIHLKIFLMLMTLLLSSCSNADDLKTFPQFVTQDLDGVEVTNKVFNYKQITVVNVWTIDSQPSIALLKELSNLKGDWQVIGIVGDVHDASEQIKTAKKIAADNSNFENLIANSDFNDLLVTIEQVPITFFVNSRSQFIGQPVIGDDIVLIRRELMRLLDISSQEDLKFIQDNIFYK